MNLLLLTQRSIEEDQLQTQKRQCWVSTLFPATWCTLIVQYFDLHIILLTGYLSNSSTHRYRRLQSLLLLKLSTCLWELLSAHVSELALSHVECVILSDNWLCRCNLLAHDRLPQLLRLPELYTLILCLGQIHPIHCILFIFPGVASVYFSGYCEGLARCLLIRIFPGWTDKRAENRLSSSFLFSSTINESCVHNKNKVVWTFHVEHDILPIVWNFNLAH